MSSKYLRYFITALLIAAGVGYYAFSKTSDNDALLLADTDIVVNPDTYLMQVDTICKSPEEYLGKTITIQGIYIFISALGMEYDAVYRIDAGCCGDDGAMHGFVFYWDGEKPASGSWVTVSGELVEDPRGYLGAVGIEASSLRSAPRGNRVAAGRVSAPAAAFQFRHRSK